MLQPAAPSTVGSVGCTGRGRGRSSSLCLFHVTAIVKLEAVLRENMSSAASGVVVVSLA